MKSAALILIRAYQKTLSPDHGVLRFFFPHGACIYRPTCSQYTHDAIGAFGVVKGARMGAQRILRCHPWHEGGFDPAIKSHESI